TTTPVLEEVVMQEAVLTPPAPASLKPPGQNVARYLQGKFERVSSWDRLFGSDYKYRLVDENGDTIAYVIVDNSLFFGPAETYWGQQVEIQGVLRRITGSVTLEIRAGNIRVLH
ncbi:hypothetical protein, partial [Cerasicoccus arenae]